MWNEFFNVFFNLRNNGRPFRIKALGQYDVDRYIDGIYDSRCVRFVASVCSWWFFFCRLIWKQLYFFSRLLLFVLFLCSVFMWFVLFLKISYTYEDDSSFDGDESCSLLREGDRNESRGKLKYRYVAKTNAVYQNMLFFFKLSINTFFYK